MKFDQKETVRLSISLFLLFALSIGFGLYYRESWLWMDEVLSYILLSDSSLVHANQAIVSSIDANPPLFFNVYWPIGHYISLSPLFLRLVSVLLFSGTMAVFFWYTTRLVGNAVVNFVLLSLMVYMTYQNFVHATAIRSYAVLLPVSLAYFISAHRLISQPANRWLLAVHTLFGLLLAFCHNYGLFYLAAAGAFFLGLLLWSKQRNYALVLASFALVGLVWLLVWYPSFAIQARAGQPHSWIPLPTLPSFFQNFGELIPNVPVKLRWLPPSLWLDVLRVVLVVGLYGYIAAKGLRAGFDAVREDLAFQFFLLSGFVYLAVIGIALVVSLTYTSVFIGRYMWPSQLLIMFQLVYAWYHLTGPLKVVRVVRLARWLPVYALLLGGVVFYKVWKMQSPFRDEVLNYLPANDVQTPVFVETADFFLPIWYHKARPNVVFLLNWDLAKRPGNVLAATVNYKVISTLRDKYSVRGIVSANQFTAAAFPRFYVVDTQENYQIEAYIKSGQVRVIRELPMDMPGHRLLECVFQDTEEANVTPRPVHR